MPRKPGTLDAAETSMLRIRACGIGLVSVLQNAMRSARKSSAYFARPVTFATTSTGVKSLPTSFSAISGLPRCAHDRLEVVIVGAAPAEIAGHRHACFLDRRFGIVFEQRNCGHDLTGRTEPALRSEFLDHGLLHRMQFAVRSFDTFDGDDFAPAHRVGQRRAGITRHIVEHHGAVAALGVIAAELRAGEAELVTQRVNERFVREHVDRPVAAVDVERHQPRHGARSLSKGCAAAPDDHVARGRHGNTRSDHALDELTPCGAKALRRRACGGLAGILAMVLARMSLILLCHDCFSLWERPLMGPFMARATAQNRPQPPGLLRYWN